jgi:hypothetical protein
MELSLGPGCRAVKSPVPPARYASDLPTARFARLGR